MQWFIPLLSVLFVVVQCNMHCYSRDQLLACNTVGSTRASGLLTTLRKAAICNTPTHRGFRGGNHSDLGHNNRTVHLKIIGGSSNFDDLPLKQPIPVVTSLPIGKSASTHGVGQDNLKPIELKARIRAGVLNCQSIETRLPLL